MENDHKRMRKKIYGLVLKQTEPLEDGTIVLKRFECDKSGWLDAVRKEIGCDYVQELKINAIGSADYNIWLYCDEEWKLKKPFRESDLTIAIIGSWSDYVFGPVVALSKTKDFASPKSLSKDAQAYLTSRFVGKNGKRRFAILCVKG